LAAIFVVIKGGERSSGPVQAGNVSMMIPSSAPLNNRWPRLDRTCWTKDTIADIAEFRNGIGRTGVLSTSSKTLRSTSSLIDSGRNQRRRAAEAPDVSCRG
jgi:hypothetical protein